MAGALKERITTEMKAALLSGDRFVGETLRNLKAAILSEEVATNQREAGLDDAAIEKVIAREVKKRHESAKIYRDNKRPDLAEPEEKEAEILQTYLPEQLGEDQLRDIVISKIQKLDVTGPQAMGQVISVVKQQVGNAADGALIAQIVKAELAKEN